jgi:hypothetical protein
VHAGRVSNQTGRTLGYLCQVALQAINSEAERQEAERLGRQLDAIESALRGQRL